MDNINMHTNQLTLIHAKKDEIFAASEITRSSPTSTMFTIPIFDARKSCVPSSTSIRTTDDMVDPIWNQLQNEALSAVKNEPLLAPFINATVLSHSSYSFETAVSKVVAARVSTLCNSTYLTSNTIFKELKNAMHSNELELGHTMSIATRLDAMACVDRDPACETLLEAVCFYKGFSALVCHRVARRAWGKEAASDNTVIDGIIKRNSLSSKVTRMMSLFWQSLASEKFGIDIHPCATIGAGVLLDHGNGIVIGETAVVGNNCTILHDVTLGSTGKESGDRHPKVGNDVIIGAGTKVLGKVNIGNRSKIGAGSLVLISIPADATAVGIPAKVLIPKTNS